MRQVFTNLDAEYLANLSSTLSHEEGLAWLAISARLLAIAGNLQRMDERSTSSYSRGFSEGKDSVTNQNSNVRPKDGPSDLSEALALWNKEVTKLPPVTRENHKDILSVDDLDL
jgi:hypothetical protein